MFTDLENLFLLYMFVISSFYRLSLKLHVGKNSAGAFKREQSHGQ